jgi:hypothetical protein
MSKDLTPDQELHFEKIWKEQMGTEWKAGDPVMLLRGEVTGIRSDRYPEGYEDTYHVLREGRVIQVKRTFTPEDNGDIEN